MSVNNANNPMIVSLQLGAISADKLHKVVSLGTRKVVVKAMKVVDVTGVAAHASNYVKVQLKKSSTLLAEHSTEVGQEGALVAGVWSEAPETEVTVDGGDLDINVDIVGTGALNAGAAVQLILHYV